MDHDSPDLKILDASGKVIDATRRAKIIEANADLLPPVGRVNAMYQKVTIEIDNDDEIHAIIIHVSRPD